MRSSCSLMSLYGCTPDFPEYHRLTSDGSYAHLLLEAKEKSHPKPHKNQLSIVLHLSYLNYPFTHRNSHEQRNHQNQCRYRMYPES